MIQVAPVHSAMPPIPAPPVLPSDPPTINIQSLANGFYPPGSFSGWTQTRDARVNTFGFSPTAKKIDNRDDPAQGPPFDPATQFRWFLFESVASGRDCEVSCYPTLGQTFLRLNNGRAINFTYNLNFGLSVGFCTGILNDGTQDGSGPQNYVVTELLTAALQAKVPGFDPLAVSTNLFVFGVSGWDVYVKLNGIEVVRFKQWWHIDRGTVALKQINDQGVSNQLALHWLAEAPIFSIPASRVFDMRDFGLKQLDALGTMAAGSNQLVLASNPGFAVGDKVIVEVGGEAGQGLRGSVGVGGTWPSLSYATVAAMNADHSKADGTKCWVQATGDGYQCFGGNWFAPNNYYQDKVAPMALSATITAIVGLTLTLDKTAFVATTHAEVHFDNFYAINFVTNYPPGYYNTAMRDDFEPDNMVVRFPPGRFAVACGGSGGVDWVRIAHKIGWTVEGAGGLSTEIYAPKGQSVLQFGFSDNSVNCLLQDIHLHGNARTNGFGLIDFGGSSTTSAASGLSFNVVTSCDCKRVYLTDNFYNSWSFANNCFAYDCHVILNDGNYAYSQWQYDWSDSFGGGAEDCTLTSPIAQAGFESFKGDGVHFKRCTGINAIMSMNASQNWLWEDCVQIIKANNVPNYPSIASSVGNSVININTNTGGGPGTAGGGIIRRPTIIQEGPANANGDIMRNILINNTTPNVIVEGTYPNDPNPKGLIQQANWVVGSPSLYTGYPMIGTDSNGCIIRGMRCIGEGDPANMPFFGQVNCSGAGNIATVQDCVFDHGVTGDATKTLINNQNNATFDATHPPPWA